MHVCMYVYKELSKEEFSQLQIHDAPLKLAKRIAYTIVNLLSLHQNVRIIYKKYCRRVAVSVSQKILHTK